MHQTIITKSDRKKFLALLKAGFQAGIKQDMRIYSSSAFEQSGSYYVSLEFKFTISGSEAEKIITEDSMDNDILDALNEINP